MGDEISCCEALLKHRSDVGVKDQGGWSELHQVVVCVYVCVCVSDDVMQLPLQATKHGHTHLIDILLIYGCLINDQNNVGNTPLHVAAAHGQVCLSVRMYMYNNKYCL